MKIDNRDSYEKLRGQLVIVTFVAAILISISMFYDVFTEYLFPINKNIYSYTFGFLFVLYLIYRVKLKYYFIIYDDEDDKIILRYYPFTSFSPKHLSIEMPFNSLHKIEIKKEFFNLRDELIIYQVVKKQIAKYKPIPLTGLSKKQKTELLNALNSFAKHKINESTN